MSSEYIKIKNSKYLKINKVISCIANLINITFKRHITVPIALFKNSLLYDRVLLGETQNSLVPTVYK